MLSDDLQRVVVTARMEKAADKELREGTEFWIESARITAGGVSGLGTLLSGTYIGMRPGAGKPTRQFVALETPPVYQVDVPGKRLTLHAEKLGSVSPGSPIYFRGIEVGSVLGYHLDENGKDVSIFAFVRAPYDAFVHQDSRFWNASGIDVSVTAAGVNVRTESLRAILVGGIAFDIPVTASASPVAEDNAAFPLFASYDAIQQAQYTVKMPFVLYFEGSARASSRGRPSNWMASRWARSRTSVSRQTRSNRRYEFRSTSRSSRNAGRSRENSLVAGDRQPAHGQVGEEARAARPTKIGQSLDRADDRSAPGFSGRAQGGSDLRGQHTRNSDRAVGHPGAERQVECFPQQARQGAGRRAGRRPPRHRAAGRPTARVSVHEAGRRGVARGEAFVGEPEEHGQRRPGNDPFAGTTIHFASEVLGPEAACAATWRACSRSCRARRVRSAPSPTSSRTIPTR